MNNYIGKIAIHEVTSSKILENDKYLMIFKFDVTINNKNIILDKSFLQQLLTLESIKKFLYDTVNDYIINNYKNIIQKNKKLISLVAYNKIEISFLGKYFYIKVYGSKEIDRSKIITALKNEICKYIDE